MKILFFLALLINITFFLWEIKTGGVDKALITQQKTTDSKQILLLNEVDQTELYQKNNTATKNSTKVLANAETVDKEVLPKTTKTLETLALQESKITVNHAVATENSHVALAKKGHNENLTPETQETDKTQVPLTEESYPVKVEENKLYQQKVTETKNKTTALASAKTVETEVIPSPQKAIIAAEHSFTTVAKTESAEKLKSQPLKTEKEQTSFSEQSRPKKSAAQQRSKQPSLSPKEKAQTESLVTTEINVTEAVASELKATPKQKTIQKTAQFCYEIGPFINQQRLNNWATSNQIILENVSIFSKPKPEQSKFLVYYPAADNYPQSKANARRLEKKGIKDLWLFRRGKLRGIISLGLFAKHSRAVSLQIKLAKKGIQAEIMRRQNGEPELFVQIKTKDKNLKKLNLPKKVLLSRCPIANANANANTNEKLDKPATDQIVNILSNKPH